MSDRVIEVEDFSFSIGKKQILCDVTMVVEKGEYLSIIGPNGAGKTTLLKCLNRILTGGEGTIRIKGRPLDSYSQTDIARNVGYVPQADGRRYPFTVYEFIMMGRYPYLSPFTTTSPEDRTAVEKAMDLTDTTRFADRWHGSLSGGESQKVHIAAALVQEADVLLLDEPTTFLDPHHQDDIFRILARINSEENVTILSVTHDINSAALSSSRILALNEGSVTYAGTPEGIMSNDVLSDLYGKEFVFVKHPVKKMPMVLPEGGGA